MMNEGIPVVARVSQTRILKIQILLYPARACR